MKTTTLRSTGWVRRLRKAKRGREDVNGRRAWSEISLGGNDRSSSSFFSFFLLGFWQSGCLGRIFVFRVFEKTKPDCGDDGAQANAIRSLLD